MRAKEKLLDKKLNNLKDEHAEKVQVVLRELIHFEADMLQKLADLRLRITEIIE